MLGRVKAGSVRLDQPRRRIPEQASRSGGEIGKPRTYCQDQIRLCSKFIGKTRASDADSTYGAGMIPNERALPRLCLGHWGAIPHCENAERFAGQRVMRPTTRNDQWGLGLR